MTGGEGRRLLILLVVLSAIAIPAGVLQAVCAGKSCDEGSAGARRAPFCPLPGELKQAVAKGYREGRSPDVLGVSGETAIFTEIDGRRIPWPALQTFTDTRVPIVFWGTGVTPGSDVPAGTTLDRIAPTVSDILAFDRPFPQVRSGTSIDGVASGSADPPRLVLIVAWKGTGTADLEALDGGWPFLASLLRDGGGTLEARTGSLPLDPSATITTIGTGGLPSQHGVTGSWIRNDRGDVVQAFGPGAPVPVIATLADDLEEADGRTIVGLAATDLEDRGLVGGGWYPDQDPVRATTGGTQAIPDIVDTLLATGFGADDVTDVLGVVMEGGIGSLDRRTEQIVRAARHATSDSVLVVVAGTGTGERSRLATADTELVDAVETAVPGDAPAVTATVPGGIFLDQDALTSAQVTGQVAVDALLGVTDPEGRAMMADAFQGFAVSFARYC